MERSARFFAEAIDIHRDHLGSEDAKIYEKLHDDLDAELSEGSEQLQKRFQWLERDLRLYSDADQISAEDKERLLHFTKRVIDDAMELSATRGEYAALGVLLKKGPKDGALAADKILNEGDLFANLDIPENLRGWFGENILAQAVTRDFSDRKKYNQEMLEQVNSNIRTIERWNLAESDAHLSRYAAKIKFYRDNKNADAVKEAEDRYNDLARKLQRQTRELFNDQVINGARSRGELQILYRLADKPTIGKRPVAEIAEPVVAEPQIDLQSKTAPVGDPQPDTKPADTQASTADSNLTQETDAASTSGNESPQTGTQTTEHKTAADTDATAGYETALQTLHKKGLALDPDYDAEAAEPALKSFVEYYLPFKSDEKIAPDDADKLDALGLAAELYHKANGDFEKMTSPELLELVLFANPSQGTAPQTADTPETGTAADAAADETAADKPDGKPETPLVTPADLDAFTRMAGNLNYDALVKQMSEQAHDGKLPAMDILGLLDEELNPEQGYNHKLAKDQMREFIIAIKGDPDQEISLGNHQAVQNLARLALAYKLTNGDMTKVAALYGRGNDNENDNEMAIIDDSVSRFKTVLAKYHEEETPETGAETAGVDNKDNPSQTQDNWLDTDNVNWAYVAGGAGLAGLALRKYLKSRTAARVATVTPAAAQPAAGANANAAGENRPAGDVDAAQTERPAEGVDTQQTRAAGTQGEAETAAHNTAEGNNVHRGQAQAAATVGDSAEMENALRRENLELKQNNLKYKEKELDDLKFDHRQLKEEYDKSPEKNAKTEKLLQFMEEGIDSKETNIEAIRREIYETERALEGRPRTAQIERTVEPARTQAERTVEAVQATESGRPVAAADNTPPSAQRTPVTPPRAGSQAQPELVPHTVLEAPAEQNASRQTETARPVISPDSVQSNETAKGSDPPISDSAGAKQSADGTIPDKSTASQTTGTDNRASAAETLNVLDDRDISRPERFGPTMDAYNKRSLRERTKKLNKEKSFLQAEREQLIHQHPDSKLWKKHEEREERYKKDRQELEKDWEGYKQRGEQLATEGKQLKTREDALNKEFADFEKSKNTLTPQEREVRGGELMTKRVMLHADSMTHADRLAYYQGAQFSLISGHPAEAAKPTRLKPENPEPYADNTKALAEAKKQLAKEYQKLGKESEKIEVEEEKLKRAKAKFKLPTDRPLSSSEQNQLKKIEDMQLDIDTKKAQLTARETALGEHSDSYTQALKRYEQREKALDAEQKKLYEKQEDLEKRSRELEREKSGLKPKDYVEKSRALASEQDNLHTERTNLDAKRAAHNGERYSHTSARPGDVLKPWQPATAFNDVKFGRGIGIGLGSWSLFGRTMTVEGRQDFKDQFSLAATGAAADVTGIVADSVEIRQATKIAQAAQESKAAAKAVGVVRSLAIEETLETASKVAGKIKTGSRLATPIAVGTQVISTGVELELGRRKGDAGRAAGATGAAAGAATGMAIGAGIGFWFGGVGAVPGAAIGVAAGAGLGFLGAVYGEKAGRMALTSTFSKWFGIDDAILKAGEGGVEIEVAKHYDLNKDGMLSLDEIKKGLEKNGIHSLSEMDTDRNGLTNEELKTALRRGLEGSAGLAKGQFSEASTPDTTLVGAGVGGPKIDPMKHK
ncbi:MAG: hypothetical protein DYH13_09500 [Alphaproteobacteria bacterium PRO2]|nr:hypothetical protein [Alphaproteobacteria bacterium PRO2]